MNTDKRQSYTFGNFVKHMICFQYVALNKNIYVWHRSAVGLNSPIQQATFTDCFNKTVYTPSASEDDPVNVRLFSLIFACYAGISIITLAKILQYEDAYQYN